MSKRKRVSNEIICGIYCIQNLINRKRYIGSSKDIYDRWLSHTRQLNKNNHHCNHLQNSWNKYGKDNFIFFIVEECPENERFVYEQFWYDYYKVYDENYGFNCSKIATSSNSPFSVEDIVDGKSIMNIEQFNNVINYLVNTDISIPRISEITGVSKSTIYSIYFRDAYIDITKKYNFIKRENKAMSKITPKIVQDIVKRLINSEIPVDIARLYNINPNIVYDIRNHATWKEYTDQVQFPKISGCNRPSKHRKAVCQYDLYGNYISEYDSLTMAGKCTNIWFKDISSCCLGKLKSAGGFIWRFKEDPLNKYALPTKNRRGTSVDQYSLDRHYIKTFESITAAKKETGAPAIGLVINGKCKTSGGFLWAKHGERLK